MHYFPGLSEEAVLWEVSYTNLNMYLATIPSYEGSEPEQTNEPKTKAHPLEPSRQAVRDFFKST